MKNKLCLIFTTFFIFLLSACNTQTPNKKPYPLKLGTYEFQTATVENLLTNEIEEKTFDSIINDENPEEFKAWSFLSNFSITIKEDTEFFYTKDNRCVVFKEGYSFELVAENTLKIHLPYWQAYVYDKFGLYDIVIILGWEPRYC